MRACLLLFLWTFSCGVAALGAESVRALLHKPDEWLRSNEGLGVTTNILSYQSAEGSWPKNTNTTQAPFAGKLTELKGTFDNGATTEELRFLARAFRATEDKRCLQAFFKGLDHIFRAQYPSGGWPQFYPPPKSYHRHITFNDDSMVGLMNFLREVSTDSLYRFVDVERRTRASQSFDKGVDCILKCQIVAGGKMTAWCAQHDELDFSPRPARTFELASISGSESVGIVRLLMSLDKPSPEIIRAVDSAVAWFESVKLSGIRVAQKKDPQSPKGWNKVVVQDPKARPLWARFYEINTGRPLFADRDGDPKYNLADIGYERRNGYAWLGTWPVSLIEHEYPAWKRKVTREQ